MYMNDISNVSKFLFTILYADVTSVLLNGVILHDLIESLNIKLDLLITLLLYSKSVCMNNTI